MKKLTVILLLLVTAVTMQAQMADPVHFTSELKTKEGSDVGEIVFKATIDPGWHVYSTDLGQDGPIEATFNVVKMEGAEKVGKLTPRGKEIKKFDEMFGMELKFFEQSATFVQKVKFTKPQYDIDCYLEFGACNDQSCLPPTQVELKKKGEVKASPSPIPEQSSPTRSLSEGGGVYIHEAMNMNTINSEENQVTQHPSLREGLGGLQPLLLYPKSPTLAAT